MQVSGANESDKAVTKVFTPQQHEDDHHYDNASCRKWRYQRTDYRLKYLKRLWCRRHHLDRQWRNCLYDWASLSGAFLLGIRLNFPPQPLEQPGDALKDTLANVRVLEEFDLGFDVALVRRQVLGES